MMRTALPPMLAGPGIYTAATHDPLRDTAHWLNGFDEPVQIVFMAHFGGTAMGFVTASLSAGSGPLMQPIRLEFPPPISGLTRMTQRYLKFSKT